MQVEENIIDDSFDTAEDSPPPYRSLSVMAVLSVVFGVFSILTIFGWIFWAIPILSIALAVRSLKQIRYAAGECIGEGFARRESPLR